MERIEIARVNHKNENRMAIARAFAKHPNFKNCTIANIIETMRSYEKSGDLIITESEAILYHVC